MTAPRNTVGKVEPLVGELVDQLTPAQARERAERRVAAIRTAFEVGVELLIAAWREGDAVALGYGQGPAGWEAYLRDRYGDLRLTLPVDMRRDRLVEMRGAGMPVSAIKATPGAGSQGLVAKDLKALREAGRIIDEQVRSFDGATRSATASPKSQPAPAGPGPSAVDKLVMAATVLVTSGKSVTDAQGVEHSLAGGVTTLDLMGKLRQRQGPVSAAQSRAVKRGRLVWAGGWRDGFAVYIPPLPALDSAKPA